MPHADDQKLRVQQATDIVDLIGEHLALRKKGREFVGLCPFHDDKNPSMSVSPVKQIYKCFSCGAGGDVFSFTTAYHRMSFPEALRYLAERAGIELEKPSPGQAASANHREQIAKANDKALAFYRSMLAETEQGRIARDYMQGRGITSEMIEAFQIGYAPDRWDALAQAAQQRGWSRDALEHAGLISPRKSGHGDYDRMRHRLIFPILDSLGRPIAFGGRKLRDEDEPKYLNSPENVLFNKSATLFGIHRAKKPIIDAGQVVIVEGYTDVIACHQAGIANVVATLGTALTGEHVRHLRRYAERVTLLFDADAAGQKAADRAVELFLTADIDVDIAVLPAGQDPADLLAGEDGPQRWQATLDASQDALSYLFARLSEQLEAADTVTGRQRLTEQYLARLTQLGVARTNPLRRTLVIQQLARLLHTGEEAVNRLLQQAEARTRPQPAQPRGDAPPEQDHPANPVTAQNPANEVASDGSGHKLKAVRLAERQVVGCLLMDNALLHHPLSDGRTLDEAVPPADFVTEPGRAVYERLYDALCEGRTMDLRTLIALLIEQGHQALADWATTAEAHCQRVLGSGSLTPVEVLVPAAGRIMQHHGDRSYDQRRQQVQDAPPEQQHRLLHELIEHRRANPSSARIARLS